MSPFGDRHFQLDTLSYDESLINDIHSLSMAPDGNTVLHDKVGHYRNVDASFLVKFTNFAAITSLPDSVEPVINTAYATLYKANYWGESNSVDLDLSLLGNDTSLYWQNSEDVDSIAELIDGHSSPYKTVSFSTDEDSLIIPLEIDGLVQNWYKTPDSDSLYVNNGFTVEMPSENDGMVAFYSIDYTSQDGYKRPRLFLNCSLYDTNGVYMQDSLFYVYGGGDIQFASIPEDETVDSSFTLSQGFITRSYLSIDSLRLDTLNFGPSHIINSAKQKLVMDTEKSQIADGDTLYISARLFRTDHWDSDSLSYLYTVNSNTFTSVNDTITLDISELLQYMVANEQVYEYEGIYYTIYNEYYDFNTITLKPEESQLDIITTRLNDENE